MCLVLTELFHIGNAGLIMSAYKEIGIQGRSYFKKVRVLTYARILANQCCDY